MIFETRGFIGWFHDMRVCEFRWHERKVAAQGSCVNGDLAERGGWVVIEVATSFPGESTVIEVSEDLVSWLPVRTNTPGATWFAIEESIRTADSVRWYRAVVRAD